MTGPGTTPAEGRGLLVIGAAGGCGTSLLAGALALAWQRERPGAWLVELDAGRGDLAEAWDLPADRTLADLVPVADELASHHLTAAAQRHPSGLTVLVAASDPGGGWRAAPARRLVETTLAAAGPGGRCVVDAGCGLGDAARGVAGCASGVLVTLAPRLSAARRARAILAALGESGADSRAALVLAGGPGRVELGAGALARVVGAPVAAALPWSEAEATELSAGRWPRRRRRGLVAAVETLAGMAA